MITLRIKKLICFEKFIDRALALVEGLEQAIVVVTHRAIKGHSIVPEERAYD